MFNGEEDVAQLKSAIESRIAELDVVISLQLNEIMHHENFRHLEASWRGLHYLVNQTQFSVNLKIRMLTASKREILKDFERALEFDQSTFFEKIHRDIYGNSVYPFGMLIGDYEFSNNGQDITLLEYLSQVAAFFHAPFISSASPVMFGLEDFTGISGPESLSNIFERAEYQRWRNFRESEASRFVGLCMPHILLREPYGENSGKSFKLRETIAPDTLCWGNAAYAFGGCIAKTYFENAWFGMMDGPHGDGSVEGLAEFENNGFSQSVEVFIEPDGERELADAGFIPLIQNPSNGEISFFSARACMKPRQFDSEIANINSRAGTKLPFILAMSRFAHYLKAIVYDCLMPITDRRDCERYLNRWIQQYSFLDIYEIKPASARYPLGECRIDVREIPDKPGEFQAIAFLSPAYRLEELSIALRIAAHLPSQQ